VFLSDTRRLNDYKSRRYIMIIIIETPLQTSIELYMPWVDTVAYIIFTVWSSVRVIQFNSTLQTYIIIKPPVYRPTCTQSRRTNWKSDRADAIAGGTKSRKSSNALDCYTRVYI